MSPLSSLRQPHGSRPSGTIAHVKTKEPKVHSMRRAGVATVGLSVAMALGACSSSNDGGGGERVIVTITERDGTIDPSGDTVKVKRGHEITLVVSSDAEDEIHVHTDPEHEFDVQAADDQRFTFSIDSPGTYEVESHELDVVIVKLQVS